MKRLYALLTSIIMASLLVHTVNSDELPISANLKVYGTYIDNIFQTALSESDCVTLTYLDTSYDVTPGASIFYDANVNLFSEHSDLRNHVHHLGFDYERKVSDGVGLLSLGGTLGFRQNTPEYDPYDRRAGNVYAALKYYLAETILGKMGYRMDYESYPNYEAADFLENYGFLQFSKFFQSRTTLQVWADAGRREYLNLDTKNGGSYAAQVTSSIKIAQSLTDVTGLQLQYLRHWSIGDDQIMQDGYYSLEDFLEDDYSYSSRECQITLKHLGPWSTVAKGTLSRKSRRYRVPSIYTADQTRRDKDITLFLEVEKKFSLPLGSFPALALHIQFLHRRNSSNDPYYDYSANIFSIGTKATLY
jgi:hypothetical protein